MAKKPSIEAIRRKISSDLVQLCTALHDSSDGTVLNPDVLRSSANSVTRNGRGSAWSYEVSDLTLRVKTPQNTQPPSCKGTLKIILNLSLAGILDSDQEDPITDLVLDLSIKSESGTHICAWHFDRHIQGGNSPSEAHPLYHFQHGGHAMKPHVEDLGVSLLLPAPRIAFPPMDAVLAIDFVLSNFSGQSWISMRENTTYLRILKESQKMLWRPYLIRLANWWDGNRDETEREKTISLLPYLA